jgi:FkbM family methyltransferase
VFADFRWTRVSQRRNVATAEFDPVQPFLLAALAEQAACRTFLDIGANIGAYSMLATKIPTVERIIAFEPNPHAAVELRANAALNGATIELHEKAVSDEPGEVRFGIVSRYAGDNRILGTDSRRRAVTYSGEMIVPAMPLDELGPLPGPLCVKIDVEGHEPEAIDGAKRLLASPSIVQLEAYRDQTACARMEALGFRRLTNIGPDCYLTNIDSLDALTAYETAMKALIAYSHRHKTLTLKRGDFAVQVAGKSGMRIRRLVRKLVGARL